jgi:hypothetical protein
MGLDMYLGGVCEVGEPNGEPLQFFGQWRKHWPLHTYIVTQFAGGIDEYNKTHVLSVRLSVSQLRTAIAALRAGEIRPYPGQSASQDLAAFQAALGWLEASEEKLRAVYYAAND